MEGGGSQVKKSLTLQGYREGRGVNFLVCVKGENQYACIIIVISILLSYLYKEILKYRQYMYTLFCMLCQ